MLMRFALKLSFTVAILFVSAYAQEVEVKAVKGGVILSVSAQQSYQLMPGETKLPTFSVECVHKGKKAGHLVLFSPGGMVVSDAEGDTKGAQSFVLAINGKKRATSWVSYGDTDTYAYFARTDEERMQFLQSLLGSVVSIQFKPFLTGTPATATFDLTKLRDAVQQQSECSGP